MARVSIFLIMVVLIAGMVGCGGGPYTLTISSTAGGSVTATINEEETMISPAETETISDIPAGTVVDLVAEGEEGYRFVEWTGDVDDIANVEDATTTITMNGDYTVTANFTLSISNIVVTPTKIGNAAVITWNTDVPTTNNIVVYDQSSPPSTPSSPGLDNVYEHVVVISDLTPNSTYYYRVRVTYGEYVFQSDVYRFIARNAKNAWDSSVNNYTVNMLITLNWDVPSTSDTFLTTWFRSNESYMAQAAQYIYDATDGYIRLGTVIVVDNQQKGNAVWNSSDMTFEENTYDSRGGSTPYTYNYTGNNTWNHTPAIENPSDGWGMQFGSLGPFRQVQVNGVGVYQQWSWNQSTAPDGWGPMFTPGWQARIITHEFGHYALYLPDRYVYNVTTNRTEGWDTNNQYDSDLMSVLGYWVNNSTFRYYTEFGARNSSQTGYSDPFGEGNAYGQLPLPVGNSSWYIIINPDPFANSTTPHYTNAHYVPAQGRGVEPAYPDEGPTNSTGGAFKVTFINN
jgi:uncharacterized repeat protein (TIGR02543 family)